MLENLLTFLNNNKDWMFEGIGLVIGGAILRSLKHTDFVQKVIIMIRKHTKQITLLIIISLLVIIAFQYWHCNTKQIPFRLASGPTGGTFSVFSTALKQSLIKDGIAILDEETQGSIENLQRLSDGKVEMALAHNGITNSSGNRPENVNLDKIKAISRIYDAKLFVAIRADEQLNVIQNIEDIPKYSNNNTLKIFAGGKKSGTRSIVNQVLPHLKNEAFVFQHSSFSAAAALLLQNMIDVGFFLVEEHAPVINNMLRIKDENKQIRFLSFSDIETILAKTRKGALGKCEYRDGYTITTICVREFLLARENILEKNVYSIIKRIYGNDVNLTFGQLSEDPFIHADYEYHSGAINYYRDNEIKQKYPKD